MKINRCVIVCLWGLSLVAPLFHTYAQDAFYVSPSGNDSQEGSRAHPWRTIGKAREFLRANRGGQDGDITVYLDGGFYCLETPLEFTPRDSGKNGHRITYRNVAGETPIISGGELVTGWTRHSGNIYKAALKRKTGLRQLYVNGARAFMAQSSLPIFGKGAWGTYSITGREKWALDSGSTPDGVLFHPDDFERFRHPDDLELHQIHGGWRQYIVCVRDLAEDGEFRVAKLQQPMGAFAYELWNSKFNPKGELTVMNAMELLDAPGEFYFDWRDHTLYYYARNTDDMDTATVIAPKLEQLLVIKGRSKKDRVENLDFEGLVFSHNHYALEEVDGSRGWSSPQSICTYQKFSSGMVEKETATQDAYDESDIQRAAVEVYSSDSITFRENTFQHIGGVGISLVNDVLRSEVSGSHFFDIGSSAINVGHPHHRWLKGGPLFSAQVENACEDILVKNNTVRDIGVDILMAPAINAFYVRNTEISHNDFHTTPYDAISLGWDWDSAISMYHRYEKMSDTMYGNKINYNNVMNYNHSFHDGGAIYTLGVQGHTPDDPADRSRWSELKGNFVNVGQGMGYYADEGTQYWNVIDNAIAGGAWLVCNPGTQNIHVDGIFTGIGFVAGATTDEAKGITVLNPDYKPWNSPDFTQPEGLGSIVQKAGVEQAYRDQVPTNLAYKKKVTLSSGVRGENSVNGNVGDSFTPAATEAQPQAYWEVDLGSVCEIDTVLIWSSHYGGPNENTVNIKDFYVFVSEEPFTSEKVDVTKEQPHVWSHFYAGTLQHETQRNDFVRVRHAGRYVRVQLTGDAALVLNEVEVFENLMKPTPTF